MPIYKQGEGVVKKSIKKRTTTGASSPYKGIGDHRKVHIAQQILSNNKNVNHKHWRSQSLQRVTNIKSRKIMKAVMEKLYRNR